MNRSFILPIYGGEVVLWRDLAGSLNVLQNTKLHARQLPYEKNSAIMSSIPHEAWTSAYKLTVFSNYAIGSLASILRVIEDNGINILAFWASALTAEGAGFSTSIIDLPEALFEEISSAGAKNTADLLRVYRKFLLDDLKATRGPTGEPVLPDDQGGLFADPSVERVLLDSLSFLHRYGELTRESKNFGVTVDGWSLKLEDPEVAAGHGADPSLLQTLKRGLEGESQPSHAMITPSTDGAFFKLTLLPPESNFRMVTLPLRIRASDDDADDDTFKGFIRSALDGLVEKGANLYDSHCILEGKGGPASSDRALGRLVEETERPFEDAQFSFVVDVKECESAPLEDNPEGQLEFVNSVYQKLERHGDLGKRGRSKSRVSRGKSAEVWSIRKLGGDWPRCFFSTNFFPQEAQEDRIQRTGDREIFAWKLECSRAVLRAILSAGLTPVQLVQRPGEQEIGLDAEIKQLLDTCPLLVSIHFPDARYRLANSNEKVGKVAPSAWVLYEEAYMAARGRKVFRFRHDDVGPKNLGNFDYEQRFSWSRMDVEDLQNSLDDTMRGPDWAALLQECGQNILDNQSAVQETLVANEELMKCYFDPQDFGA